MFLPSFLAPFSLFRQFRGMGDRDRDGDLQSQVYRSNTQFVQMPEKVETGFDEVTQHHTEREVTFEKWRAREERM